MSATPISQKLLLKMQIPIKIGCSGWSYPEWRGKFYPQEAKSKDYFMHYVRYFNTVEINSTFYHLPSMGTIKKWYEQAPTSFQYTLKVNRDITHFKKFHEVKKAINDFYALGEGLEEKLAHFLFQLPPSFNYSSENLERIITQLNSRYTNVIEFRHASWWRPEVFTAFESSNLIFCSVSGFNIPEELIVLAGKAYIRFHGDKTYGANYSDSQLALWFSKIKSCACEDFTAYFNNTRLGYAPYNALSLIGLLQSVSTS